MSHGSSRWLLDRLSFLIAGTTLLGGAAGCAAFAACPHPERVTAPPVIYLRPPHAGWNFRITETSEDDAGERVWARFAFDAYDDVYGEYRTVRGELHFPSGDGPFPLVAVGPILGGVQAGYLDCRIFARNARRAGAASYFLFQEPHLLEPSLGASELERKLRSWVHSMIRALDLLCAEFAIDEGRLATFGISMGALRTVLLAAAEPRFRAHVFCLAGGGLDRILADSVEPLVRRYLERRSELLLADPECIVRDFRSNLVSDPLAVAASVDPDTVLMFLARNDRTVPVANGFELHRALGEPELRLSPLGHLSSLIVLPWAVRETLDFYRRSWSGTP